MSEVIDILRDMEKLLDALIENAEQMKVIALQAVSGEELKNAQKRQDQMIRDLKSLDVKLTKAIKGKKLSAAALEVRKSIDEKLERFEAANSAFIDALIHSRGIIGFDSGSV